MPLFPKVVKHASQNQPQVSRNTVLDSVGYLSGAGRRIIFFKSRVYRLSHEIYMFAGVWSAAKVNTIGAFVDSFCKKYIFCRFFNVAFRVSICHPDTLWTKCEVWENAGKIASHQLHQL